MITPNPPPVLFATSSPLSIHSERDGADLSWRPHTSYVPFGLCRDDISPVLSLCSALGGLSNEGRVQTVSVGYRRRRARLQRRAELGLRATYEQAAARLLLRDAVADCEQVRKGDDVVLREAKLRVDPPRLSSGRRWRSAGGEAAC